MLSADQLSELRKKLGEPQLEVQEARGAFYLVFNDYSQATNFLRRQRGYFSEQTPVNMQVFPGKRAVLLPTTLIVGSPSSQASTASPVFFSPATTAKIAQGLSVKPPLPPKLGKLAQVETVNPQRHDDAITPAPTAVQPSADTMTQKPKLPEEMPLIDNDEKLTKQARGFCCL